MSNVPTNLIPTRITGLPEYVGSSTLGYIPYVLEGRTYKVQFANIAAVGAVPSTRVIGTGNGLEGGGDLSQNRVISIIPHGVGYSQLDFTGVTAGTYGSADTIPSLTIDATGRVTAAVNTPVVLSNYVPTSRTVTAGAGLTGGGQLNNNITIALNPSNATPQPLGAASPGTGTQAARDDHVHPAVDLTDTSETQGVLPLGRGGTGVALSPVVGAVIYADNDSLNQTTAGNAGQILKSAGGLGAPYWDDLAAGGTVTSVSVVSANGFAGTVANPSTTPAITLTTTVSGLVKGNGSALSAAIAGTDYVAPGAITTSGLTMATDRLLGRTTSLTGAVEEITVGTGLTLSGGSLVNSAPDQTVTLTGGTAISISGSYPSFTITNTAPDQIVSLTGAGTTVVTGTYPNFTITSNDQYTGTVTSVAASGGTTGLTFTGSPITTSGTLTLGGTLVVANGGTGATTAADARTNLGAAASGANSDITSLSGITGGIATPDYIDFDTTATVARATGRLWWDSADGIQTLNLGMAGSNATLQVGEEMYFRIKASSAITEGQVVMFTGSVGNSGALTGAPATGLTKDTASYIMGVATEDIALNGWGYVTQFGLVRNINTTGGAEAWVDGQILYYNPAVAGGLTKNVPSAPNAKVEVAAVVNAASNGSLFVRPIARFSLGQLNDVETSAAANGDLIQYNSGAGYWQHSAPSTITVGTATNLAGGAANRIAYQTGSGTTDFITAPSVANTFLEWSGSAFQWSSNPLGTVTSVAMTVPTGLTVSGSPITTSGTLAVSLQSGYSIPTTASQTNWDTAYSERLQWDGGSTNLVAATGRTSLGATTVGSNFFTLTNPSAITFPRINADNTVSALSASDFRTAIGAGTGNGSVTSVDVSGGTTGLTFSGGPVTTSGTITMAGTLAVGNGGTGTSTAFTAGSIVFAGASGVYSQDNANLFWDDTNNRLGVGTTSPGYAVEVTGDLRLGGGGDLRLGSATGTTGSAGDSTIYSDANDMNFSTANTIRLYIANGGNVGIGNTAPGAKLDVTGNIRLSAANPNIELNNGGAMVYSPAGNTLAFAKGGGPSSPIETMRIDSNGVVGINVVPSAWQSGRSVLQVGTAAVDTSNSAQVVVSANRYFDGTNDRYIATAFATAYQQLNGAHIWYRAASGTAGATMTLNENARFDTSGNLLLGTSTTKNRLTVTAGANTNSPTLGSAGGIAYFTNTDVAYGLNVGNSAADGRVWLQAQRTDGSATAYNITLNEAGGNVGIGQSSPTTKLWVGSSGSGGSGTATPDAISLGNTFANSAGDAAKTKLRLYQDSSPAYYGFGVSANLMETHVPSAAAMAWYTGNTERMRLTSTGVLGLGISGGDASFHIVGIRGGNGRMTQMSTGGTSQDNLNLIASSNGGGSDQWFSYGVSSANYFFIQNGTSVGSSGFVVASNNRVGIGISTPSGPLDVRASAGTTAIINSYNDSTTGNVASVFSNLQSNANSTSSYHYAGVTQGVNIWYLYGNGTSSWSSDMRLKKNIETTRDGYLEDICRLRVVKYNWHTDADDKPRELGLIAQEVESVFPGLVEEALHTIDESETKYKVLKGSVLPYMLLKALQEANAKIEALTARVADLEGK